MGERICVCVLVAVVWVVLVGLVGGQLGPGSGRVVWCKDCSTIKNKARTNTLQLNDRNRHTNKLTNCMDCDKDEKEDIYHFMLHSTAYK